MRQQWISDEECVLDGITIRVGTGNYAKLKTTVDEIVVLKGKRFFEKYDNYLGSFTPARVLEVGIFEGGSAILLADKWPTARIVGVDIRDINPAVQQHIKNFGFDDRISLHYNVSQNDVRKVQEIIDKEFDGPIDIVIDDCSHLYDLTKSTFNTVFPYLLPGGFYVVEDWGWAHWRDWQDKSDWASQPALTNLLFELILTCPSSSWLISDIYVNSNFFAVKKALTCPTLQRSFDIAKNYLLRGKTLPQI